MAPGGHPSRRRDADRNRGSAARQSTAEILARVVQLMDCETEAAVSEIDAGQINKSRDRRDAAQQGSDRVTSGCSAPAADDTRPDARSRTRAARRCAPDDSSSHSARFSAWNLPPSSSSSMPVSSAPSAPGAAGTHHRARRTRGRDLQLPFVLWAMKSPMCSGVMASSVKIVGGFRRIVRDHRAPDLHADWARGSRRHARRAGAAEAESGKSRACRADLFRYLPPSIQ